MTCRLTRGTRGSGLGQWLGGKGGRGSLKVGSGVVVTITSGLRASGGRTVVGVVGEPSLVVMGHCGGCRTGELSVVRSRRKLGCWWSGGLFWERS